MALNIIDIIICTQTTSSYTAGDGIIVYWNDTTDAIYVEKNSAPITSGGDILATEVSMGKYQRQSTLSYQFCFDGHLNYFEKQAGFPYVQKRVILDSPLCALPETAPVCDIQFTNSSSTGAAYGSNDGTITVVFQSSGASIKISIGDFDYRTQGTATSGGTHTFTGLSAGTYPIFIKDANGCSAQISIVVQVDYSSYYGELYSFTYLEATAGYTAELKIFQRGFSGLVTELAQMGAAPVIWSLNGQGKVMEDLIIPTSITAELVNLTTGQFVSLFKNSDEQKFQVVFYVNSQVKFKGFITNESIQEPVTGGKYITTISATDRLYDLKNYDFGLKKGNNSILKIILHCLNQSKVPNSGIRIADNLYEASHDQTAADDPWEQTYMDVQTFYDDQGRPDDCYTVIEKLLTARRCQLFSQSGFWYVMRVSERKNASIAYRQFDMAGTYATNSTHAPRIEIKASNQSSRAVFLTGANRSFERIFKKVKYVTNRLVKRSLVNGFTVDNKNGNGFFGWLVVLGNEQGSWESIKMGEEIPSENFGSTNKSNTTTAYIERPNRNPIQDAIFGTIRPERVVIKEQDSAGSLANQYVVKTNFNDGQSGTLGNTTIGVNTFNGSYYVTNGTVEYTGVDKIEINFDYYYQLNAPVPLVKFKWSLKVGALWLRSDGTWQATERINEYVIEELNKGGTFSISAYFDESFTEITESTYTFKIYNIDSLYGEVHSNSIVGDLVDTLSTYDVSDFPFGHRLVVRRQSGSTAASMVYYELRGGSIEPDAYGNVIETPEAGVTWNAVKLFNYVFAEPSAPFYPYYGIIKGTMYFGSISIKTYGTVEMEPQGINEYNTSTEFNQQELNIDAYAFDADTSINNFEQSVVNYFKLSDGSPTQEWGDDAKKIQEIVAQEIAQFYSNSKERIKGAVKMDVIPSFWNVFLKASDENRIYLPMMLNVDFRTMVAETEIVETAADDEAEIGAYDNEAYSTGYF